MANVTYRITTPAEAAALHGLRRRSILAFAPDAMSIEQARQWADKGSVESMAGRLHDTEGWVAETDGQIIGWVAIREDYLDALYVAPESARRGIGTQLLQFAEEALRARGIGALRVEASWNSEAFYIRRGYEPLEPRSPDGARQMRKRLPSTPASGR